MQMQMRLVCLSACPSGCLSVYVSALRGMPHLAFNQKQTANSQQPTANSQQATANRQLSRENEASRRCRAHSTPHMRLGQGPLALCFPPANRCGRGHGLHSATVYFSLLCSAFAHFGQTEAKPQTKPKLPRQLELELELKLEPRTHHLVSNSDVLFIISAEAKAKAKVKAKHNFTTRKLQPGCQVESEMQ